MQGVQNETTTPVSRETASAYDSTTFKKSMTIRVEQPVGAMSISPSGRDVVLASRDGLHIIDLDNPFNPPRFLRHLSSWEVADVQWSPFAGREYWVISTSNQKALVWNLNRPASNAVETVLHGHSRAITDINFSAHNPDHLATCAIDSFVHVWDMKAPRRPVLSFSDWFAGATQVKYNRQDEHIIASSHDKFLHIWDRRKGAFPLQTINAHDTKIYGIDWNRTRKTGIVTCSLDKAIKFWDYSVDAVMPERVLRTNYPVWRARHTPFGWGLLAMPQRGDNDLYLYDRRASGDAYTDPVTKFSYHDAPVKEFLWRARGGANANEDDREFQLVTWSKDRDIRLWEISPRLMKGIGHNPEAKLRFRLTRLGAQYRTFRREPPVVPNDDKGRARGRISALNDVSQRVVPGLQLRVNASGQRLSLQIPKALGNGRQTGLSKSFMSGQRTTLKPTTLHRDMNPIQWMKGIKIQQNRDGVFGLGEISDDDDENLEVQEHEKVGSKLSLDVKPAFGWTGPESLSDEITLVGLRFSKVKFEKVNINNRTCLLSFTGPWGINAQWVFLRCAVQFPARYPDTGAAPVFVIDKTMKISDQQLEEIYKQLRRIADSHLVHRKFCLEACLSYLLGERAEDAMYWDSKMSAGALEEDTSSDEEIGSDMNNNLQNGGLKQLIKKNNKGNVPLTKACGAMWSESGHLVCFFAPKPEQPQKSFVSILNLSEQLSQPYIEKSSKRLFESFGRLKASIANSTNKDIDRDKIDDSGDELSLSSSAGSISSGSDDILVHSAIQRKIRSEIQSGTIRGRNDSTDRSTQRSTTTSQLKPFAGRGQVDVAFSPVMNGKKRMKNYFTLHDYSHILPSKQILAQDYAIYGPGVEVCLHNAGICTREGYYNVRDVWMLAGAILCRDVPLEYAPNTPGRNPMLVIAPANQEKNSKNTKRRHTGLNSQPSGQDKRREFQGRVKWGNHPCGHYLVRLLLDFFEAEFDPQMLAMLSCIFLEPETKSNFATATLQLPQQEMPISVKTPGFSLDYYPSFITALRRTDSFNLSPQNASESNTPLVNPGSYSSSIGDVTNNTWLNPGNDAPPISLSGTPPTISYLAHKGYGEHSGAQSMSSSPEQYHAFPTHSKRSTGISQFTGNIARALTTQAGFSAVISSGLNGISSSPPTKKFKIVSPDQNTSVFGPSGIQQQLSAAVTWSSEPYFRSKSKFEGNYLDKYPEEEEEDVLDESLEIDLQLYQLESFDDEGSMNVPLLDQAPNKSKMYRHYRETYADMLYTWELPLQRLEILKFNGLKSINDISLEKMDQFSRKNNEVWDGLDINGKCPQCESPLNDKDGIRGICRKCKHGPSNIQCVICNTCIKGRYNPCLRCGHIFHTNCHLQWFRGGNKACPSGCGCIHYTSDFDDIQNDNT